MENNSNEKQQQIKEIESNIGNFLPANENYSSIAHAFHDFYQILKTCNENVNLVSNDSFEEFIFRHVLDSISVVKAENAISLSKNGLLIDIGSGAGFPGLPIKIAFPSINLISVESITKKANFQKLVVEVLHLGKTVIKNERAESLAKTDIRGTADIVVSRAVASISTLIEISLPFLKIGGKAIFYKSFDVQKELIAAENAIILCGGQLSSVINYQIRPSDPQRSLIIIEKTHETPSKYPRKSGIPFKRPL
jgi:16S rRNA (guanine527-N7)-methyltransferase